jgi:hypothetical protein
MAAGKSPFSALALELPVLRPVREYRHFRLALCRVAWRRPRFVGLVSCFVAGFCPETVGHFSGTC